MLMSTVKVSKLLDSITSSSISLQQMRKLPANIGEDNSLVNDLQASLTYRPRTSCVQTKRLTIQFPFLGNKGLTSSWLPYSEQHGQWSWPSIPILRTSSSGSLSQVETAPSLVSTKCWVLPSPQFL